MKGFRLHRTGKYRKTDRKIKHIHVINKTETKVKHNTNNEILFSYHQVKHKIFKILKRKGERKSWQNQNW